MACHERDLCRRGLLGCKSIGIGTELADIMGEGSSGPLDAGPLSGSPKFDRAPIIGVRGPAVEWALPYTRFLLA